MVPSVQKMCDLQYCVVPKMGTCTPGGLRDAFSWAQNDCRQKRRWR